MHGLKHSGGALLGLCGIILLWAGVFHSLSVQREQALRDATQNTSNLARAFEEHIVRTVKAVDQTLLLIRAVYEKNPAAFDIATWASSTKALTDVDSQIGVINRDGLLIASNYPPSGAPVNLSDREHFLVHRNSDRDELFISKPVMGRASHKRTIQLTRKVIAADGSFDGVTVLSLDPDYMSSFYNSVDLGKDGIVTIASADGTILASGRGPDRSAASVIGQSLAGSPVMMASANLPSGTLRTRSRLDNIRRLFSWRVVRGYPLIVIVGISEDEVLLTYASNRNAYFLLAGLMTALILAVAVLTLLRQNRLYRARELLRASEAAYAQKSTVLETTLDYMSQGILMLDSDSRIQVCNQWVIDKMGLPGDLMASHPAYNDILMWQWRHGEFGASVPDIDAWSRQLELADVGSDKPRTCEQARPNGTVLEIRSTPAPRGGVVLTYIDITPRKKYEAELQAARDEADRAARVKSEFLATMSHEIRSPMSGMLGVLEILSRTKLDDDQSRMAGMVRTSASGLLEVLNDILDFSKIEAERLSIVPEPVDVRELVNEAAQPREFEAARKGVGLTRRFSPEVPDFIEIDPLRLRQIINNLLSNAVKFTSSGTIELAVDVQPGPTLRLVVRDSGIGMTEDVIARLFEPFMQADGSTTRIFGGTGLGLSISRRLARLLGGDLVVTSRAGEGSAFSLVVPLIEAAAPHDAIEAVPDLAGLIGTDGQIRVLVADDDPANRWVAKRMVEILGLHADVVEDGEMALQALHAAEYHLLITDCHMPRMDGVALTAAVRAAADPGLRGLPIIGLTADVTVEQRDRCHAAGMTAVAIKPLTIDRLSRLLSRHLGGQRDEPAALPAPDAAPAVSMPFDDRTWREIFTAGDPDGEAWLAEYQDAASRLIGELAELLAAGPGDAVPREAIGAAAHRLAGSSFSVGASATGDAARALERAAAEDGDLAVLLALQAASVAAFAGAQVAMSLFLSHVQSELAA